MREGFYQRNLHGGSSEISYHAASESRVEIARPREGRAYSALRDASWPQRFASKSARPSAGIAVGVVRGAAPTQGLVEDAIDI